MRAGFILRTAALGALLLVARPALAARIQVGDSTGGEATPVDGSDVIVSFNPTIGLKVHPRDSSERLLGRIASSINAVAEGVYTASTKSRQEVEVLRADGGEIDDLQFLEDDTSIQSVGLTLGRSSLIAWIGKTREAPAGGSLILTLNEYTITIPTAGLTTASEVDTKILTAVRGAGFSADAYGGGILVFRHLETGQTISHLGWRSADQAIISSELGLYPDSWRPAASGSASGDDPLRQKG